MTTKKYALSSVKAWKASEGDNQGQFEAIVSVFGNVDSMGDRVLPGAFVKSIEKWQQSGDQVPVIFSHAWDDPFAIIGSVVDMAETEKGLWVRGQLDLENPTASQVYRLLKNRQLREFSFAYSVLKEKTATDGANDLLELDIIEVGPTLKGANSETELLAVKSAPSEEEVVVESVEEEPKSEAPAFDLAALQHLHDAILNLGGVTCSHSEASDEPKVEEPEVVKTDEEEVEETDYLALIDELTPKGE